LSLKSEIGKKVGPYQDDVTAHRISSFCKAVGAEENGIAPPTFLTLFRKGEFELFQYLGLELSHVLHAEQEYQYEEGIQPGDRIHFETVLTQVLEKQSSSSKMQFLSFETHIQAERRSKIWRVGKSKTTIVVRG
jgi:hypothetical protein